MKRLPGESSLAGWSMFVLSVVLVVVYLVFFSIVDKKPVSAQQLADTTSVPTTPIMQVQIGATDTSFSPNGSVDTTTALSGSTTPTPSFIVSTNQLFGTTGESPRFATQAVVDPSTIMHLSGTHHRKGVMKSANFLGIQPAIQYILKNNDNTHFAYLGKELPEISDRLTQLRGKTLAFIDKNDIHANGLFGDKVIFLQVPEYAGIKQLFFVYFAPKKDRWFLQVDADIFETTKPLLAELFTKRY